MFLDEKIKNKFYFNEKNDTAKQEVNFLEIFGKEIPHGFELTSKLFCHLISDQYSPMTVGTIHSKIYPDDFFNPFSSPDKVYQILKRLNKLTKQSFDLEVQNKKNKYQISYQQFKNQNLYLEKEQVILLSSPKKIFENQLKANFANNPFTALQLSKHYKVSKRTINRWIKILEEQQVVKKEGQGKNTRFKIAS